MSTPAPRLSTGIAGPVGPRPATLRLPLGLRAYRVLTRLARPLAPAILRYRIGKGKEDPARQGERLGIASAPRPDGTVVWVHAASVGETSAVLPLMAHLEASRPDLRVLLTTGTVTSARFAAARMPRSTIHQFVPLDLPPLVARFLDYWRPALGIFTEQEIWPNLVLEFCDRAIPLALVNARMSQASYERWRKRPALAHALFSGFAVVLAQNEILAQRLRALGAARALAAGNLKIDAPPPPVDRAAFEALRTAVGTRPCILAASTHHGEELAVGEAHVRLAERRNRILTIIVPRHPERGAAIAAGLAGLGLRVSRRSEDHLPSPDTDIYVADTIGELGTFYALCPVSFVGGSLIPHGGQNPIEAVRHGSVVVVGPSCHNFADAYAALLAADGAVRVDLSPSLAPALERLIGDDGRCAAIRANATRAIDSLSGALVRTTEALLPLLPAAPTSQPLGTAGIATVAPISDGDVSAGDVAVGPIAVGDTGRAA